MKMKGQPNYVQSLILFVLDRFLEFKLLRSKREKNASPKPLPSLQQVDSTYYVYEKPTYNPLPGNSLTQLLLYCTQPSRSRKSQLQQEELINWFQIENTYTPSLQLIAALVTHIVSFVSCWWVCRVLYLYITL